MDSYLQNRRYVFKFISCEMQHKLQMFKFRNVWSTVNNEHDSNDYYEFLDANYVGMLSHDIYKSTFIEKENIGRLILVEEGYKFQKLNTKMPYVNTHVLRSSSPIYSNLNRYNWGTIDEDNENFLEKSFNKKEGVEGGLPP